VSVSVSIAVSRLPVLIFSHLRSAIGVPFLVMFTGVCSLFIFGTGLLNLQNLATHLIRGWAQVIFFYLGIRAEYRGAENFPAEGGGIVVFNHQSLLDIPALYMITEKKLRFGAKIELFRIPFFGAAMRSIGTLPIARQNRTEVLRIYREAEARFKENTIFVLAPEGTRQHEPRLGRFKKGPFLFAINGQVPVIPVVIRGAYEILPKGSWGINLGCWSRAVHIEVLPPVSTRGLKPSAVDALVDQVREEMALAYEGLGITEPGAS
jgi:1-acyl-sn-glycerol-3-phosphate acyltransferase